MDILETIIVVCKALYIPKERVWSSY